MNKFFRRISLQAKLMLIGLIPFCFLIYLTYQVFNEQTEKLELFNNYRDYINESANIGGLIDALQEERKFSFDYTLMKGRRQELVLQRPETDAFIRKLVSSNDPALNGFRSYTRLGELDAIRNKIDSSLIDPNGVMHYYSNTVFRMNTLNTLPPANTPYLRPIYKDLQAQKILSEMTTYLGIISSNIYNVLHTKKYMVETLYGTIGTHDVFKSYQAELLVKASPEVLERYKAICNTTALKPTMDYISTLFRTFQFDDSFDAKGWYAASDEGSNELRKLQATITKRLNSRITRMYEAEQRARNLSLLFLILALVAVVLTVAYIVYIINRMLKELRKAAEKISNGETGVIINAESDDAIGSLARSISKIDKNNQALAVAAFAIGKNNFTIDVQPRGEKDILGNAIVKMKSDLQQYSQEMEQLVSERTDELARSNEDLQQFAHVASHDLKEPLRKIAMFSKILSDEQKDILSEKGKVYLGKIRHASQRMSTMIEGVLAYSTVTVNEPPFELVDLNLIMEGVMNDLELAIIQKEAKISYSSLPHITGIQLQLHQLLYNLVNNSLKFSKKEVAPIITISSEIVTRHSTKKGAKDIPVKFAHITLTDNGIGFNREYTERMFGVFFRLNAKDDYEGTGLGLALCRKVVHRHGGEIYAEGEEGEGAVFHILLPVNA